MSSFRPDVVSVAKKFLPGLLGRELAFEADADADSSIGPSIDAAPETPVESGDAREAQPDTRTLRAEEIEALESDAYQRGLADHHDIEERLTKACHALEGISEEIARSQTEWLSVHRDRMLDLALEIARSWVGEDLSNDSSRYARVLDRALESCQENEPQRVRLHPEDLARLDSSRVESWRDEGGLDLAADDSLMPGEFIVEARSGVVDARGASIVARLRDVLCEEARERSSEVEA